MGRRDEGEWGRGKGGRTLSVHGHVKVADGTVGAEDLAEVVLVDVFGELLDDDLEGVSVFAIHSDELCPKTERFQCRRSPPGLRVSSQSDHNCRTERNNVENPATHLRALRRRTPSTPTPAPTATPRHDPISIPSATSATAPASRRAAGAASALAAASNPIASAVPTPAR